MEQLSFPFDVHVDTMTPVGHKIGRIFMGREGGTATLYLMPDGVHLFISEKAKEFVHFDDGRPIEFIKGEIRRAAQP